MRSAPLSMPLFSRDPISESKPTGLTLRKYQEEVLKKIRWHTTHDRKRILLVAPCASGKMVMIAAIIKTSTVPILFVAHRRELLDQLVSELAKYGITHVSVIRGDDDRFDPSATIQVASIQSLMRRDKPKAGLIFIDEAHRAAADSIREHVFDAYPEAVIIGATATPTRLDGQPLGDLFEVMEVATTYAELIRLKHILPPDVFGAPVQADLSGVRINHGDYNQEELGRIMGQQHLRGQLVQNWIARAHLHRNEKSGKWEPGPVRRTLVFASTVEHSKAICADFARMSVKAAHLDGETPDVERSAMLAKLKAGELDVLSSVNVLLEGVDIPEIKCIAHARPTQSLVLWIQSTARALRLWNGITPLILDHGSNCVRHGFPHDDRIWSLTKSSTRHPGNEPTKLCPKCHAYVALSRYGCPVCGHEFPEPELRSRVPTSTHEILVELSPGDLQRAFYDEQVTKARTRGFKPGYAAAKFKEKMGFWPPYGWSEATKSSFASDLSWQQALSVKEAYRAAHKAKQVARQTSEEHIPTSDRGSRTRMEIAPLSPPAGGDSEEPASSPPDPRSPDRRTGTASEMQDTGPAPGSHSTSCTQCDGAGCDNYEDRACDRCGGSGVEPDNDYLRDPEDAPFAAWLDEEGIR